MEKLYLYAVPGKLGGAATKARALVRLLRNNFAITVVLNDCSFIKDKSITGYLKHLGIEYCLRKDVPAKADGIALAICEVDFFSSGTAASLRSKGLKVIFSNEMMWEFKGEREAVQAGLVDKVLFASEFQAARFEDIYMGIPWAITGNYVDPELFQWKTRTNETFTIGRLSRSDPVKYSEDFPVFYEELGLKEVKYRVMAWDQTLRRKYRWHRFGDQWDLLSAGKEDPERFLQSLDLFVYHLGHAVKESWGRSTVEAMLTGCIPLVPSGHQFHRLMLHGESGFICSSFDEYRDVVTQLFHNASLRERIALKAAEHAREKICNEEQHRKIWCDALLS